MKWKDKSGAAVLAWMVCAAAIFASANKPNIIIILTDDHGFTDLGVHGIDANVDTPAMDTLASRASSGSLRRRRSGWWASPSRSKGDTSTSSSTQPPKSTYSKS